MKITFYYVRHGRTLFNELGRMQGQCDSPLTKEGIEGAQETASVLRKVHFNGIYCSDSQRARDTAEIIGNGHGVSAVSMKGLKEFDFGVLDGELFKSKNERIQSHRISDDWTDVGGENVEIFGKRAEETFRDIIRHQKDGDRVLIVSHGSYFMHLMKTLLQYDQQAYIRRMNEAGRQWVPNCSISVFSYEDGKWNLDEEPMSAAEYRQKHDPKCVHFYLMRHGETVFNTFHRIQGWCDSPLTEKGIAQAQAASVPLKKFMFNHVYASPTERARDTARIITGREPQTDVRLREVFYGSLEGEDFRPIMAKIQYRHAQVHYGDLGGEEREDVEKRIRSFLRDAVDQADDGDNVLMVSHGDYYMTLMETLFDIKREIIYRKAAEENENPMPNCGLARFDYKNGEFQLIHEMKRVS